MFVIDDDDFPNMLRHLSHLSSNLLILKTVEKAES